MPAGKRRGRMCALPTPKPSGPRAASRAHVNHYSRAMTPFSRELLDFWFGPPPHAARAEWFRKDPAFDATIRERFGAAIEAVLAGATPPPGADIFDSLAHVVLLDQFTRNAYR